jgi:hypothetical protein
MSKPTLNIKDIVEDCELAIGEVLIKHMPLATSGDVEPMQAFVLEQALENAIRHWWRWNGSDHYNLKVDGELIEISPIEVEDYEDE